MPLIFELNMNERYTLCWFCSTDFKVWWCLRGGSDTVAEWLRRVIRNHLGLSRVGSSPAGVDFPFFLQRLRSYYCSPWLPLSIPQRMSKFGLIFREIWCFEVDHLSSIPTKEFHFLAILKHYLQLFLICLRQLRTKSSRYFFWETNFRSFCPTLSPIFISFTSLSHLESL